MGGGINSSSCPSKPLLVGEYNMTCETSGDCLVQNLDNRLFIESD